MLKMNFFFVDRYSYCMNEYGHFMFVYFYSLCNPFFLLPIGISLHLIGKMASDVFRNVAVYKIDRDKLPMSLFL